MLLWKSTITMNCNGCAFGGSRRAEVRDGATLVNDSRLDDLLRDIVPGPGAPTAHDSDQALVEACLRGEERAWVLLIERYKRLIYSFPRRYGADASDAADVFQVVCAELFVSLPRLRNHQSLRSWIMTVASHQAYHWKQRHVKRAVREGADPQGTLEAVASPPPADLEVAEREQMVREAVAQLPPRCRELVQLLFYQDPPEPYETVARKLGLAIGSIGLTRARCLRRIQDAIARVSAPGRSDRARRKATPGPAGRRRTIALVAPPDAGSSLLDSPVASAR